MCKPDCLRLFQKAPHAHAGAWRVVEEYAISGWACAVRSRSGSAASPSQGVHGRAMDWGITLATLPDGSGRDWGLSVGRCGPNAD